jgi:leucyl-tRNA synthetase
MDYKFREIEKKWQNKWKENKVYKVSNESTKPKYYVLDMFPYPSGAGLHVGHPLGYIASDIYSRYKRLKGFNVLHPMGFDSFGLPAEQYAIETGQHPAETTKKNIATFKSQLDKIGFCYDWEREVQTSDPNYYKWTQKIFLELYNSYFCNTQQKARPIAELVEKYATKGCNHFTAEQWNGFSKAEQEEWLMKRRLAFSSFGEVNWCEALGTVLANDEVVNGVSERGGHPVVKKKMRQWYLRITAYADRLLQGLETVDFSESMKEMQRNWIGRSEGAEVEFAIKGSDKKLKVYTTRPDTIFGVDFMVLAPELDLVNEIKSPEQAAAVEDYMTYVKSRSDRERQADVKQVSGCFTGAYAINPFNGVEIPIWIAEYVLAGYGTGAIMAVPCGDERDFRFAQHFNIPVTNIIGAHFNGKEANPTKEAILENSGFLNGLLMKDAIGVANDKIEAMGIGKRKVNFKMRDAGFSRQRYWGEPFPIIWDKDGVPTALDVNQLPLELPHVEKYGPGPEGEGPLANITDWVNTPEGRRETSTMPGYAGSSWYFLRYMDPNNTAAFVDRKVSDYWNSVDLYIGGTEHAVGHLLYSRMWTKVLYDLGYIGFDEPFKKLLNQGMIQGSSRFIYLIANVVDKTKTPWVLKSVFLSEHLRNKFLSNKNYFD